MSTGIKPSDTHSTPTGTVDAAVSADRRLSQLGSMLTQLEYASGGARSAPPVVDAATDNLLIQQRLGIAGGLFLALQSKHAATATHSLHVALTCSGWALEMQLDAKDRDRIEVAALLHDVGIIGVPDQILLKPGKLTAEEAAVMTHGRRLSREILRGSTTDHELLDMVGHVSTWYDGSNRTAGSEMRSRADIPLGARMIAIAEAFDSMITDHVFRPARSQEQAMKELLHGAGKQFDPQLVDQFAELALLNQSRMHRELARQWLRDLQSTTTDSKWRYNAAHAGPEPGSVAARFQALVLERMHEAVIFVDPRLSVITWNHGAEQLTGIAASSVIQRQWDPELLKMRDARGKVVGASRCPLRMAIGSGQQSAARFNIRGRSGKLLAVDGQAIPVPGRDGAVMGAALLLHDSSFESSLQERYQNLRDKATLDPLTQLANRAEFDRGLAGLVDDYQKKGKPFSFTICDLDHFKRVNDDYGHQAGDDVIVSMATVLKDVSRPDDLVARYGGEEFVLLCSDCGIAAAAKRAETIRRTFAQIHQPKLNGRRATASFGVTEFQPGDSAETVLRRADRALLMAKDQGRNRVVQLGAGAKHEKPAKSWAFWRRRKPVSRDLIIEQEMLSPVTLKILIEKLRGFVADQQATVVNVDENSLELQIETTVCSAKQKREHRAAFVVNLLFAEESSRGVSHIRITAKISSKKPSERCPGEIVNLARQIMVSLQAYVMASPDERIDEPLSESAAQEDAPV